MQKIQQDCSKECKDLRSSFYSILSKGIFKRSFLASLLGRSLNLKLFLHSSSLITLLKCLQVLQIGLSRSP
ncbi:Uncharacterized protein FKW44_018529, partial [Caligus rogercresseyi]